MEHANVIDINSAPIQATDLRSSGILVTCMMHGSTLTVTDKRAGDSVAADNDAARASVAVIKKLAANMPELRDLQIMRQTMYNGLKARTYDFAGDARYLPATRFEEFAAWWSELVKEHAQRKAAFLAAWPDAVATAAFQASGLGRLFDRNDYPSVEELDRKFYVEIVQSEVPVGDFRNVLFHEALGDAKASLQQYVNRTVQGMLDSQMQQMKEVLTSLSHCCTVDYEDTDAGVKVRRRRLHQSTVEKAVEMCRTFQTFNPAGSGELEDIRRMLVSALDGMSYAVLQSSDACREQVKEDVDTILNKFSF